MGYYTIIVAPIRVKFGIGSGPCQLSSPSVQRVASGWGEKTQNRLLSNLNTGALRCAQCCR